MKHYEIKHRPNDGDYAVIETNSGKVVRTGPTKHDVINIKANLEANLPATEVGFGSWGIPSFLQTDKKAVAQ